MITKVCQPFFPVDFILWLCFVIFRWMLVHLLYLLPPDLSLSIFFSKSLVYLSHTPSFCRVVLLITVSLVSLALLSLTHLLISFSQTSIFLHLLTLSFPPRSYDFPSLPSHRVRPVGGRTWQSFWAMPTSHHQTLWPCWVGLYQAGLQEVHCPVWPPDPITGRTAPPVGSVCSSAPDLER